MSIHQAISLRSVIATNPVKIGATWLMVAAEILLTILLPLFIGYAIDGVMNSSIQPVLILGGILFLLVLISVLRRYYDTRIYGDIRVKLAQQVEHKLRGAALSTRDARISMSRELIDFLEVELPPLMTSLIQLVAGVVILATFHFYMAMTVFVAGLAMLLLYSLFHNKFTQLNGLLNDQLEQQVKVLSGNSVRLIHQHFTRLKGCEVRISDTEALVYGLIFTLLFCAVLTNLWLVNLLESPSVGEIFAIVTYSLEFVEAAVMLPVTLQSLSRLTEISQRLNQSPTQIVATEKELTHEV